MKPVFLGVVAFAVAFAAWRWLLGNRNWLEGAVVALVFAGLVTTVSLFVDHFRDRPTRPAVIGAPAPGQ